MKSVEIKLPTIFDESEYVNRIETIIKQLSFTINTKTTLDSIPGSIHWHIKNGHEKGTLEATIDIYKPRFWLSYHDNRYADWIDEAIVRIKLALES